MSLTGWAPHFAPDLFEVLDEVLGGVATPGAGDADLEEGGAPGAEASRRRHRVEGAVGPGVELVGAEGAIAASLREVSQAVEDFLICEAGPFGLEIELE